MVTKPRSTCCSWRVVSWKPDEVHISGIYRGWSGVALGTLFPFVQLAPLLFAFPRVSLGLLVAWFIICLGVRFHVILRHTSAVIELRWYGITLETIALQEELVVDIVEASDDDDFGGVYVGSASEGMVVGDSYSAHGLADAFDAALASLHGEHRRAAGVLLSATTTSATPAPSNTEPVALADAVDAVSPFVGLEDPLVLVNGWRMYEENGSFTVRSERVGIFVLRRDRARLVFDAYLRPADVAELEKHLAARGQVIAGEWDEAALTSRRRLLWCRGPFRAYDRGKEVVRMWPDALEVRGQFINRASIAHVESWVSHDWSRINVRVICTDGSRRVVAHRINDGLLDILYDGWDLEFDTMWSESMASMLADALGVPWRRSGY